jgi:hypothetical protein
MTQAIAGVAPPDAGEVTVMTVFPSIGAWSIGRFLGRLYLDRTGFDPFFHVGKLIALLTAPLAAKLFLAKFLPYICTRYRLTNRRVTIEKGLRPSPIRSVELDDFDRIEVEVGPGQAWYPCGDLIFFRGKVETFRLAGVQRPETFRRTCLKARDGFVHVQQAVSRQRRLVPAGA